MNNNEISGGEAINKKIVTDNANALNVPRGKLIVLNTTKMFVFLVISFLLSCVSFYCIWTFANAKSTVKFSSSSNARDIVHLKENNYFPSSSLENNGKYISSLINTMDLDFHYEFRAEKNLNYIYSYYIDANTIISDSNDNMIL